MAGCVHTLTPNSISSISTGNLDLRPVLQILDVKEIGISHTRYRLLLSDGSLVQQSILASQLDALVRAGKVVKGTIVQLLDYVCHTIRGLKVIMVLNMEIIGLSADTIGNPKQFLLENKERNGQSDVFSELKEKAGPSTPELKKEAIGVKLGRTRSVDESVSSPTMNPMTNDSSYGRPVVSTSYEPAPIYSHKGPISQNQAPARIMPISALNPYQGRWTIKARVTAKGDLRRYHNIRGDGKVFSFDLLDADGGEIRATCFNSVADRFLDKIEVGKVYMVSKGALKPVQRNFNHLRNDWEIFLENSSIIELCTEEDVGIRQQQFKFVPISELENMEGNSMVDVIGVMLRISPANTIVRRNGTETQKQTAHLWDSSGRTVELTLWGSFCTREGKLLQEMCESGKTVVLAVKTGRISDFSGKSLGTISTTQLHIDPDLPEANDLRIRFESKGRENTDRLLSQEGGGIIYPDIRKTISQIKGEGLGRSGKPDWIVIKGIISFVKTDRFCYTACPLLVGDKHCNRKVTRQGDGTWYCDRCSQSTPECAYRYLLSLQIQDHTGVIWATAFQEAAEEILGVQAKELYSLQQDVDPRFNDVMRRLLFMQKLFKLKIKEENYNGELSVKCMVVKSEELAFQSETKVLLEMIEKLLKDTP